MDNAGSTAGAHPAVEALYASGAVNTKVVPGARGSAGVLARLPDAPAGAAAASRALPAAAAELGTTTVATLAGSSTLQN